VKIKSTNPPATPEAISEFERLCGFSLPSDYRDFLQRHNGGEPTPDAFPISPSFGDGSIGMFFGLHDGDDSLADAYRDRFDSVPAHMIPIADDGCGNFICMSLAETNCGSISFLDHETDIHHPVASSFITLLSALYEPPPVQLKPGQVKSVWIDPDFLASLNKSK
jgi:cell wall assembly regulator SMI1